MIQAAFSSMAEIYDRITEISVIHISIGWYMKIVAF